jgi:hypothetical protein
LPPSWHQLGQRLWRESASSILVTARSWSSDSSADTFPDTIIVADMEKINEEGCPKFCQARSYHAIRFVPFAHFSPSQEMERKLPFLELSWC